MSLKFADDNTGERGGLFGVDRHEAEFRPLVEKVSVNVYAVGFREILTDQLADLW